MPSGLQFSRGDIALALTTQGAGTVQSGSLSNAGDVACVLVMVHCTTITGTTPTLDVSVEESDNGNSGWTAVPNSAITQITAAANRVACCATTKSYVRVSATVGGTTPAVTARVGVLVFGD